MSEFPSTTRCQENGTTTCRGLMKTFRAKKLLDNRRELRQIGLLMGTEKKLIGIAFN